MRSGASWRDWVRRLPWGGIVALMLVASFDRVVDLPGFWPTVGSRIGIGSPRFNLLVRRETWLEAGKPAPERTIAILGSSRATGISSAVLRRQIPGVRALRLAVPGAQPFELNASASALAERPPRVVILTLSEFETHRPVRLESVTGRAAAGSASLSALWEALSPAQIFSNLGSLLRIATATLLDTYRYRAILGRAWFDGVRRFDFDGRERRDGPGASVKDASGEVTGYARGAISVGDGVGRLVSPEVVADISSRFDGVVATTTDWFQIPTLQEITAGSHVGVQEHLIADAVEQLTNAGVQVVIIETPLHPQAARTYDRRLREEFLDFAHALGRDPQVTVVELSGRYGGKAFSDMLHLGPNGRTRLTRNAMPAILEAWNRGERP